ncbi:MAG: glycosyltransferase [Candidatus Margulisiibacteriota bacterium]|jgi:1,2-diacylglycerol 3-alpha-glucosyltransferase
MKIAIFTDCYTPIKNGVVTSVVQLKEGLEKKGHLVLVVTIAVPNYIETDPHVLRIASIKLGLGTEQRIGIVQQKKINDFLKAHEIELIHTHTEFSLGFSGKAAARKFKLPHIHTTHTMWEDYRHYILNGMLLSPKIIKIGLKFFIKTIKAIIAPSIKAKNYWQKLTPHTLIEVIPNGIDLTQFQNQQINESDIEKTKKSFGITKNDKVLIYVGRIGQEKRIQELYDTITPVITKNKHLKMIIVGDGPLLIKLKEKTKKLELTENFLFTGFVNWETVHKLYCAANIFVTASLSEVHPMTIIEALFSKLPIIARKDDSIFDLVNPGVNGYLTESDSDLGKKIEELINDSKLLNDFSCASLLLAKNFTLEEHIKKVENLYKKVLNFSLPAAK